MPRSNRPRTRRAGAGGGAGNDAGNDEETDLSRALLSRRHTESRRDGLWNVQPLSATNATKIYTCPGCGLDIGHGVAHTVAWRADGIMGEADDLAGRRHWHVHCWKVKV